MQVERERILRDLDEWRTGEEHVRIYLSVGDNFWKRELIPNMLWSERISPRDDLASDELVGVVTAHQGDDQ